MDTAIDLYLQMYGGIQFVGHASSDKQKHQWILKRFGDTSNKSSPIVKTPFSNGVSLLENNNNENSQQNNNILCFCAENQFRFYNSVSYPDNLLFGVGVSEIRRNSATFRVGVVSEEKMISGGLASDNNDDVEIDAVGKYVHVFVNDDEHQRPVKEMPEKLKKSLEKIFIASFYIQ